MVLIICIIYRFHLEYREIIIAFAIQRNALRAMPNENAKYELHHKVSKTLKNPPNDVVNFSTYFICATINLHTRKSNPSHKHVSEYLITCYGVNDSNDSSYIRSAWKWMGMSECFLFANVIYRIGFKTLYDVYMVYVYTGRDSLRTSIGIAYDVTLTCKVLVSHKVV